MPRATEAKSTHRCADVQLTGVIAVMGLQDPYTRLMRGAASYPVVGEPRIRRSLAGIVDPPRPLGHG